MKRAVVLAVLLLTQTAWAWEPCVFLNTKGDLEDCLTDLKSKADELEALKARVEDLETTVGSLEMVCPPHGRPASHPPKPRRSQRK